MKLHIFTKKIGTVASCGKSLQLLWEGLGLSALFKGKMLQQANMIKTGSQSCAKFRIEKNGSLSVCLSLKIPTGDCVCVCLSFSLPLYLSVCLSVISVCLSLCLSICRSIVCLMLCLSVTLYCMSACRSVCLHVALCIGMLCLHVALSVYFALSVCMLLCQNVEYIFKF